MDKPEDNVSLPEELDSGYFDILDEEEKQRIWLEMAALRLRRAASANQSDRYKATQKNKRSKRKTANQSRAKNR